jgi:hypothetical protein
VLALVCRLRAPFTSLQRAVMRVRAMVLRYWSLAASAAALWLAVGSLADGWVGYSSSNSSTACATGGHSRFWQMACVLAWRNWMGKESNGSSGERQRARSKKAAGGVKWARHIADALTSTTRHPPELTHDHAGRVPLWIPCGSSEHNKSCRL